MINWIDPKKELPEDGIQVAAMAYNNKSCWPLSAEIIFGVVDSYIDEETGERRAQIDTCDFTGSGSFGYTFFPSSLEQEIDAWAYATEFKRPDFIEHSKHWGKEFEW